MTVRFAGRSQAQVEQILLVSMRDYGMGAADRYQGLISAAVGLLQSAPGVPYSQLVPREPGVRALHLKHANRLLEPGKRVGTPRHLVVYRVAPDGVLEVLGIVHDRMLLSRAAGRARRDADSC